ncbi:hypothetical protein A2767_01295 [Candidatus Roizmanbacteria bacterium RIFCSPHIGHO2_01_FULL_35_10]|uniref:Uncharacterized protein n=1 Tax=Candidatus Roizmanbacteria bacterium RIFCSPLOWO2_01_FULL_35_13 TaxID=1802055 RepID=A0A1F7I7R2_9BACT|nr:MAG: hypothetical protein A2767_01295 [Candidatus Roizmanbacteria bacterium RIFCSPHIGHO2_01_FULL_35_10]OGK39398.1 MAG: hypothetical protein A3A74_06200 [Candidatus Roizmanbacteria bacterium RIFCSPLOWO2_01_FULL_35_13]
MSSAVIKEGDKILYTFSHEDFLHRTGVISLNGLLRFKDTLLDQLNGYRSISLIHYFYRSNYPLTLSVEGVLRAEIAEGRDNEIAVSEFKNGEKGFQLIATGIRVLHLGD